MPFTKHLRTASCVYACQLLIETQQDITDELSSGVTAGRLADWTIKLNDLNGCQEHKFRYQDSTEYQTLNMTNWLVRSPAGDLRVYTNEQFMSDFYYAEDDYVIPEDKQKTFETAMLDYLNQYHPELYLNNQTPTITPYQNLVPVTAYATAQGVVTIEGSAVIVAPAHPANDRGSDVEGLEVIFTISSPTAISKILVGQVAGSYNAPNEWSMQATNSKTGETRTIALVSASMPHPGYYSSADSNFMADTFKFRVEAFEYPDQFVDNFMISVTTGGKFVEGSGDPTPLTAFTDTILEQAAETLNSWYNPATNAFTINAVSMGITSVNGLSWIVEKFMHASFLNKDTKIILNFSNNHINPEAGIYPNLFTIAGIQELCYELRKLPAATRTRIIEINFTSVDGSAPSAIAPSVTKYTEAFWNDFTDTVIRITSTQQPSQIKK